MIIFDWFGDLADKLRRFSTDYRVAKVSVSYECLERGLNTPEPRILAMIRIGDSVGLFRTWDTPLPIKLRVVNGEIVTVPLSEEERKWAEKEKIIYDEALSAKYRREIDYIRG